jgi:hypothetical protein
MLEVTLDGETYKYFEGEDDIEAQERRALYAETPEEVQLADWRIRRAMFLRGLIGDDE